MSLVPADLRLRLVAAFVVVVALSQVRHLWLAALALVVMLAIALMARRDDGRVWRRMLHVEGFVVLLFLMLPFTVPGEPVFTLGPLSASVEGFARAALIACKVSACVLALILFLGAIDPQRIGGALRGLRVPAPLVRLFVLTARYVGLFRDEVVRLREAMRARAFHPGSNRHTWRSYGNLIGMLLIRALARAERIEEAMLARGYQGRFPYAAMAAPVVRDWVAFGVLALLAVAIFVVDRL